MKLTKFKNKKFQKAYDYARENHLKLMIAEDFSGDFYRLGYYNLKKVQRNTIAYAVWCAGRDKCHDELRKRAEAAKS